MVSHPHGSMVVVAVDFEQAHWFRQFILVGIFECESCD